MKKAVSILLMLCLMIPATLSLAESGQSAAGYSGTVDYRETISIRAPFGGILEDTSIRIGDRVTAGQTLFTLETVKVYAPFDGTVRGLRAQPGDAAADISARYGALCYLEPVGRYTVSANTANAYDSSSLHNANRYLNEGETVYLRSSEDNTRTGTGIITTVNGSSFEVEVQSGNLDLSDKVSIYRDDEFSTIHRIASYARVQRAASAAVTAEGSVLRCDVTESQAVKRGDVLFETVTGTLEGLAAGDDKIIAPVSGAVVSIAQSAGTSVTKDALLATLYADDAVCVRFDVDEGDLDLVKPGQNVTVKLDALPDRDALTGTITSISAVSSAAGDAKYAATVTLDQPENLNIGMNVSVYLP